MVRSRLDIDLEKSLNPYSLIVTNSNNEAGYLPPGSNDQILGIVSGNVSYITPNSNLIGIFYGSFEITGVLGVLEYTLPYTLTTISHFQVTQVKNSTGGFYFAPFGTESTNTGIKIYYDLQPPVGQKIKFNYLIIK